jgi:hypothetical protein
LKEGERKRERESKTKREKERADKKNPFKTVPFLKAGFPHQKRELRNCSHLEPVL